MPCNLCGSDDHRFLFSKIKRRVEFSVVSCKNCGFMFMNPMITEKKMADVYTSEYYDNYDYETRDEKKRNVADRRNIATFERIMRITGLQKGNLLDVGCAAGFFLKSIKDRYSQWNLAGCDVSEQAVKTGISQHNFDLRKGEIVDCKYDAKSFDLITMREVIEHVAKPMKSLNEINRILKESGFLVVQTGNMRSIVALILGKRHFYFDSVHVSYFSLKTLKYALANSGFKVIYVGPIQFSQESKLAENGFNLRVWGKLQLLRFLSKLTIGNFSVMGGMFVVAKKVREP